jgi:UDP-3-O-[3-hydroxymyristoyl] N-acetylglucosamine deacetylase
MPDANAIDGAATPAVRQKTLRNSVHCSGIGLHCGTTVGMTIHPAAENTGIRFHRTDLRGAAAVVTASWRNVVEAQLCTTLANTAGTEIATVEHVMAALYGCGVDNAEIEVSGGELPIMDGSAWPFVFLIECAGIAEQSAARRAIAVKKPVAVGDAERSATLAPAGDFSVAVSIDYGDCAMACQTYSGRIGEDNFKSELARARTYGFLNDAERLRAAGFARGASLDNAVVVEGERVLNRDGLRYTNEMARHKALDAIGDLYLAGAPLIGAFAGRRSGHKLYHRLLAELFADETAWSYVAPAQPAPAATAGGGDAALDSHRLSA